MKKIYGAIIFLLVWFFIFLTACTSKNNSAEPLKTSKAVETSSTEKVSGTETTVSNKTLFEKFEDELLDKGYSFEKITKAAEIIGAIQGIGYKFTTGSAEIYIFDEESEKYKEAEKTKSVYIDGFGACEATVKNGAALITSDLNESDTNQIVAIFYGIV